MLSLTFLFSVLRSGIIAVIFLFIITGNAYSTPTVQVGIYNQSNILIIKAKPNENITSGVMSASIFTLRYLTSYGISAFNLVSSFGFQLRDTYTNGSYTYKVFQSISGSGALNWTANDEYEIMRVTVSGGSGYGTFVVGNDAFTLAVNGSWYFEHNVLGDITNYANPLFRSSASPVPLNGDARVSGAHPSSNGLYLSLERAFDAINAQNQSGNNIVIEIISSISENGTATLTGAAGIWTSLKIYPTSSGLCINKNTNGALIDLNGADNVTIDGRVNQTGSKDLIIQHTSAADNANRTISFQNSAENNTIQHCIIKGCCPNPSAGVIFFSAWGSGNGNDNNVIDNCDITNGGIRPLNCIYSSGTASSDNSGNTISNNNIYDHHTSSIASYGINLGTYSTNFTISGNSFYETGTIATNGTLTLSAINVAIATGAGNVTVSGNYIGGKSAQCGGTAFTINTGGAISYYPINLQSTGSTTMSSITNNTIKNIDITSSASANMFRGINSISSAYANVTGNVIGASDATNSIRVKSSSASASSSQGVYVYIPADYTVQRTYNVSNNIVGGIFLDKIATTTGHSFTGIDLTGDNNLLDSVYSTVNVENNLVGSNSAGNSILCNKVISGANSQTLVGINTGMYKHTINIKNNAIANLTNFGAGATAIVNYTDGIRTSAIDGNYEISNNTIRDLKSAATQGGTGSNASIHGICHLGTGTTKQDVFGNTVYNLENTTTAITGVNVTGIHFTGPVSVSTSNIYRNFVHSLKTNSLNTSTNPTITGIEIYNNGTVAGTIRNVYNNIVSIGSSLNNNCFFYGIFEWGTGASTNRIYFNTVYIGGSPNGNVPTNALRIMGSNTSVVRNIRNNIFMNSRSRTGGAGKHYAAYFNNTTGLTVNNNDYYTPGTGGTLGFYNSDKTSLPIVTGQDANSVSGDPIFVSATDFHIQTTAVSPVSNAGTPIAGITTDIDGDSRSATAPDIGADEYSDVSSVLSLNLTALIEGFYNGVTMVPDTVTVELRNAIVPYTLVESKRVVLSSTGTGTPAYSVAVNETPYYIVLKHRNAVETWSGLPQTFSGSVLNYDFTTAASQAFGNNMVQVDSSPLRFAVYSGDVNQDGTVDATDLSTIDNDASNFMSGYVITDLTGDSFVDGTDFALADNNAANFVSVIRP